MTGGFAGPIGIGHIVAAVAGTRANFLSAAIAGILL